ncbi:hypothetical protein EDD86DRAFT_198100 [Gorgonomyces haynaldii]|nr:hypothetical protein EDD86DRAFT_198100 [Gorgonomyces haynaldii]
MRVNDEHTPILIDSDLFSGYFIVRMKDFRGVTPEIDAVGATPENVKHEPLSHPTSEYFKGRNRRYSIAFQGRFKRAFEGDELVFGVDFDIPLRAPMGTSVGIKIAKWLDPTIQADIDTPTPYMFSPFVTAMNALTAFTPDSPSIMKSSSSQGQVEIISSKPLPLEDYEKQIGKWSFYSTPIPDDCDTLFEGSAKLTYEKRKKLFSSVQEIKKASVSKDLVYCCDFYDAYFDFNTCQVKLPGFSLNCFKYWDGQPMRFSLQTKDRKTVLFYVIFELVPKDDLPYFQSKDV